MLDGADSGAEPGIRAKLWELSPSRQMARAMARRKSLVNKHLMGLSPSRHRFWNISMTPRRASLSRSMTVSRENLRVGMDGPLVWMRKRRAGHLVLRSWLFISVKRK